MSKIFRTKASLRAKKRPWTHLPILLPLVLASVLTAAFLPKVSAGSPASLSETDTESAGGVGSDVVDYAVAQTIHPFEPYVERKATPIPDEDLEVRLDLNKETYDRGEPIIATLKVTNLSSATVIFHMGNDYRSGRRARFSLSAVHESGRPAPDALLRLIGYGMGGGLGGWNVIEPGKTRICRVVLQLYAVPREPGDYTCEGKYFYGHGSGFNKHSKLLVSWPSVRFRVRNRPTPMTRAELLRLQTENELFQTHPSLFWGIRGQSGDIPELVHILVNGEPSEPIDYPDLSKKRSFHGNRVDWDTGKRNGRGGAAQALCMMSDQAAVYAALNQAIEEETHSNKIGEHFTILYWTAVTPENVGVVEKFLDHPNESVRRMAFRTALSLGGRKAFERLPEALESPTLRHEALVGASSYVAAARENSPYPIPGLSPSLLPSYLEALLEGYRKETDPDMALRFPGALMAERLPDALDIVREIGDPERSKTFLQAAVREFSYEPFDRNLSADAREKLVAFAREQAADHPDPRGQETALNCLRILGDKGDVPIIEKFLTSEDEGLRFASAFALYMLRHGPRKAECIDILSRSKYKNRGATTAYWLRRLGVERPGKAFASQPRFKYQREFPSLHPRYQSYMTAVRASVLRLAYNRKLDDKSEFEVQAEAPLSINRGYCPNDPMHSWNLDDFTLAYLPFCSACGAELDGESE